LLASAIVLRSTALLIVGAYKADPNGNESGKSYVIFGKTDTVAIDLAKLGGDSKYAIETEMPL
jgi:hypothetical protein